MLEKMKEEKGKEKKYVIVSINMLSEAKEELRVKETQ